MWLSAEALPTTPRRIRRLWRRGWVPARRERAEQRLGHRGARSPNVDGQRWGALQVLGSALADHDVHGGADLPCQVRHRSPSAALLDVPLPWTRMRHVYALLGLVEKWGDTRRRRVRERARPRSVNIGLITRMLARGTETTAIQPRCPGR